MKQLLIIRHAKSSWDSPTQNDFDRPLNGRGHKDAPNMVKHILGNQITIDAFISSTAARAFTTATYFAEAYKQAGFKNNLGVVGKPELYHASPTVFYEVIGHANDEWQTIAVFAHNPGITEFVNGLTNTRIDDMPTCGIFAITIDTDKWSDFEKAPKSFWFFEYPKNL
ncbi:SixA phosphatase family protein [Parasediminibacterium sp. JCM 36343]|uniref:SixA phosphatase family protein n=1 Tax=Parasediminibacterium sp. JCM 36343 TaxID=3374279 RepID=UPI00397D0685